MAAGPCSIYTILSPAPGRRKGLRGKLGPLHARLDGAAYSSDAGRPTIQWLAPARHAIIRLGLRSHIRWPGGTGRERG